MAQKLPIEIVREILSTATEVFLLSDRATALGIALTSTLGYHAAIPILYRTVYAIEGNIQAIRYLFNNHGVAATELGKTVSRSGTQNHVADLAYLKNLQRITSYYDLDENDLQEVAHTLTHLTILASSYTHHGITSLTHVSYHLITNDSGEVIGNLARFPYLRTITHITLDMSYCPSADEVLGLHNFIQNILARRETVCLAVHIFASAPEEKSRDVILRALRQAARSEEDRKKLLIWYDERVMAEYEDDAKACMEDLILGRNAWTEGRQLTQNELHEIDEPDDA